MKKTLILLSISILFLSACGKQEPVASSMVDSGTITEEPLIGGDTGEHGCKGSAGYSWCESKEKCMRKWEEYCEDNNADQVLRNLQFTLGFVDIQIPEEAEFSWNILRGPIDLKGMKITFENMPGIMLYDTSQFFQENGFEMDIHNIADGTIESQEGYIQGNMACLLRQSMNIDPEEDLEGVESVPTNVEILCGNMSGA